MSRICWSVLIFGVLASGLFAEAAALPDETAAFPVVYKGTERSTAWVETYYAKFKDSVVSVAGRWVSFRRLFAEASLPDTRIFNVFGQQRISPDGPLGGPKRTLPPVVSADVPEPGTELRVKRLGSRVLQILDATHMIIHCDSMSPGAPEIVFHVEGVPTTSFVDGSPFECAGRAWGAAASDWLVYVGTHRYVNALGTVKTIPSYRPHRAATKAEFAEALREGLELVEWVETKTVVRPPKGSKEKPQIETNLVAKPVP